MTSIDTRRTVEQMEINLCMDACGSKKRLLALAIARFKKAYDLRLSGGR